MKRLLKISFDSLVFSLIPIIQWFVLGLFVDSNLINVFSVTYPLQFIYSLLKSAFGISPNIYALKEKNKNAVMSGIVFGIIFSIIIFGLFLINVDNFINFMNMDIHTYKTFTISSVIQLFISLEFAMILNKLYYEEKNTLANKYSLIFNLLNFILLIATSLITKNQVVIIVTTLIPLALFTLYIYIKNSDKFKLQLDLIKCIKYDSVEFFNNISFFLIFLFGLSNALEFGWEYANALTFIALITDTQWDTANAVVTAATIDISKSNFNYKYHRNNAYKLLGILFLTSLFMFVCLYWFYDLNFIITMIYFGFEIVNFILYPIYRIKTCYLQLEWSAFKITSNKIIGSILRMAMSLLKTPFCTGIGQVSASIYQFISVNIFFKLNYNVDKVGRVIPKKSINEKYPKAWYYWIFCI